MLKKYKNLPWPRNLWSTVFRREIPEEEIPRDWECVLNQVLNSQKNEKRAEIIYQYFREKKTLKEIGKVYGTGQETIRQLAEKALREIRHPSRKTFMTDGYDGKTAPSVKQDEIILLKPNDENLIDSLSLSVRSWNCLKRAGINTIDHLTEFTETDLSKLRNMGKRSILEIKECLAARGLSLKEEEKR